MSIQPNQPQPVGGVLDVAFQLYKASMARVLPVCALAAVCDVPAAVYSLRFTAQMEAATDPGEILSLMGQLFTDPVYWSLILASWLVKVWLFGALTLQMNAIANAGELKTADAVRQATRPVASLFLVSVLYLLIIVVGMVVLIPGIIFTVSLLFVALMVLLEGKGPFGALAASHRLVWGCWWRTSAILTVGGIIAIVIYSSASLVTGLLDPLFGAAASPVFDIASTVILTAAATIVLSPLYAALLLAIYWDLKLRKHGGDLAARVGALGVGA